MKGMLPHLGKIFSSQQRDRHGQYHRNHGLFRAGAGCLRAAHRKPAALPRRPVAGALHRGEPARHRPRARRRVRPRLRAHRDEAHRGQGKRPSAPLRRHPGLHRPARGAGEADRLSSHARDALRHAPPAAADRRGGLRHRAAHRRARKRHEPDERRRDFPLRRRAGDGRRPAHERRERSALPPRQPREHGKRLSHPVDVPAGGRLGRAAARAGLSDGGDGAAGRLAHAV